MTCPGSADSWQGSFDVVSPARVYGQQCLEAASELVQTPAWLCPMGYVLVSSLGTVQASPFKGPGCLSVLTAVILFFIVLEALLKCPPKLPWLFWVPQPGLCLIQKSFDDMTQELKLQHFDEIAKTPPQFEDGFGNRDPL